MKRWIVPLILGLFMLAFFVAAYAQAPDTTKKAEPAKASPAKVEPVKTTEPAKPATPAKAEPVKTAAPVAKIEKPAAPGKPTATGVLKVEKIACGTSVAERELEGQDTTFAATIEKVYCWSLITGGSEAASVNHVWYHDGKEVVKIPINVKYPRARVYSYKSMSASSKGEWKVEVVDAGGQALGSTTFKIQ